MVSVAFARGRRLSSRRAGVRRADSDHLSEVAYERRDLRIIDNGF
jgi:hypothetical protein